MINLLRHARTNCYFYCFMPWVEWVFFFNVIKMPFDFLVSNFFIACTVNSLILNFLFYFSAIAVNLKACNHFRLYNGKAAEVRFSSVCVCLSLCLSVFLSVCLSFCLILCLDIILVSSKHFWLTLFFSGRVEDTAGDCKSFFQFCQWSHQTQSGE